MITEEKQIELRRYDEMKRRGLLAEVIEGDNVLIFKPRNFSSNNKRK